MVMSDIIKNKRRCAGIKTITESEIIEIQSYYDKGNSLRDCQKIYGYCRGTLIKYLKTRAIQKQSTDKQIKENKIKAVVEWRVRVKKRLVEYKGGKCIKCGYDKYIGNLTFHHLDPSKKEFQISGKSIAFEKLKSEADKCVLLCHNCHGEIHAGLITL